MCRFQQSSAEPCQGCNATDRLHAAIKRDLCAQRREFVFLPPLAVQWRLRRLLCDPRDVPNAYLLFNLLVTAAPAAGALFALPPSHCLGAVYLAVLYAVFLARFLVALLHVTQHRRLFTGKEAVLALPGVHFSIKQDMTGSLWQCAGCRRLNFIAPHLLAPLFGVPSGLYGLHHVIMHHTVGAQAFT